jgi:hypothetical protein
LFAPSLVSHELTGKGVTRHEYTVKFTLEQAIKAQRGGDL